MCRRGGEKWAALLLIAALPETAVLACGRSACGGSGALRRGAAERAARATAHRSSTDPREELAPEPGFSAWAHWWDSPQRPPTEHHTIHLNGRRVELIREALLPGWHYPCTDADLEAALRSLPAAWTAHLRSVRWTFHPEWDAHARTDRARIEVSYVVNEQLEAWGEVTEARPEELDFGARLVTRRGSRYLLWPDTEALRTYLLRHILIHELGHHVAPPGMPVDEEEEWAESFAYRYYTPARDRSLAAAK